MNRDAEHHAGRRLKLDAVIRYLNADSAPGADGVKARLVKNEPDCLGGGMHCGTRGVAWRGRHRAQGSEASDYGLHTEEAVCTDVGRLLSLEHYSPSQGSCWRGHRQPGTMRTTTQCAAWIPPG